MSFRQFSAPGRVEICGNHTDHQRGRVLTAAVDLETTCRAVANGTCVVHIDAEGYGALDVNLSDLAFHASEAGTTAALVRGVAAWFAERGRAIGGFDAFVRSDVPVGSGLSSSAAFEVLIGSVFKGLFGADVSPLDIALAGQFAENVYFGKPCGLMDQCASSFGGLMAIDFENPSNPVVTPVSADFTGYALCVVDTGGSHADLTDDYAAIPAEMRSVARFFGKEYLREVDEIEFYSNLNPLRAETGDRAVLRAMHFFDDTRRVADQAEALTRGDLGAFFALVNESGRSSLTMLQNVFSSANPRQQGLTLALAVSEFALGGRGACRVHGGGFAGTILAFVPDDLKVAYRANLEGFFGAGACKFLNIRERGGCEVV